MSLASYIGCNVELPLSSEDSNDVLLIGNSFSEDYHRLNVKSINSLLVLSMRFQPIGESIFQYTLIQK